MTQRYAAKTTVTPEQSRLEIERCLQRYGADGFGYLTDDQTARTIVMFRVRGLQIKLVVPKPEQGKVPRNKYVQAERQMWRAVALNVKAKLEAVESGLSTLEEEFLAYVVTPDGETVGEHVIPDLHSAIEAGRMPPMLPAGKT